MFGHTQNTRTQENLVEFLAQGERFFEVSEWKKASQCYESAVAKLTEANTETDECHRKLALCYYYLGTALKDSTWDKRDEALNYFVHSIKNINQIANKNPDDYQQIKQNYENLRSLFAVHTPEHDLFNLGAYLFSGYTHVNKELFEDVNYTLSRTPTVFLSPSILDAWLQLLQLVRFTWKAASFPAECPMHTYLENENNLATIDKKIIELKANSSVLSSHLSRGSNLLHTLVLDLKAKDSEIKCLKENIELLNIKIEELQTKKQENHNASSEKRSNRLF